MTRHDTPSGTQSDNESKDPSINVDNIEERNSIIERVVEGVLSDSRLLIGGIFVSFIFIAAIFAPYVAPYGPEEVFASYLSPTTFANGAWHLLGTDSYGYDILTRIIYGTRVSMTVAMSTVVFAFSIGTTIGLIAGYYGGRVDDLLMRYIDFQWAFPELILAVAIIAFFGSLGIWNVIIAIGLAYVDDFARIVRGEVLSAREEDYVTAANAIGMSDTRILFREILPNIVAPLIVQITLMIPLAILAEAGLSFLGLGVQVTTPTWGILLSQGRSYISSAWWISVMPGLAIMLAVLSLNLLGDGLRDAFDEKNTEFGER